MKINFENKYTYFKDLAIGDCFMRGDFVYVKLPHVTVKFEGGTTIKCNSMLLDNEYMDDGGFMLFDCNENVLRVDCELIVS